MCLYPRLIKNRKYTSTKKNGGNVPVCDDIRKLWVPRACGDCMECRKKTARDWAVRLSEDIRHNKNGKFVNLTFSNQSIRKLARKIKGLKGYDLDNEIATQAMRYFLERWRKEFKKAPRHWFVTELGSGETEHLHLHGIIWTDEKTEKIVKHWQYGTVHIGEYLNEETIQYMVKYVHKKDELHEQYKSKVLTSDGIGRGYIERLDSKKNKYNGKDTIETYKNRSGIKLSLPIYYRNKIYSEEEREKLWVEKLDKQVRYVGGEKIDISKGEEEYEKVLAWYQAKSKRLGYGDGSINWDKKKYENERRMLKIKERIEAGKYTEMPPAGTSSRPGIAPGGAESINDSLRSQGAIKPSKEWD